jgi:hypothetical protein
MERSSELEKIKLLFGKRFIGIEQLKSIQDFLPVALPAAEEIPTIPYTYEQLKKEYSDDYILILGSGELKNGLPLNLLTLRDLYGIDPDRSEPCFYNQDWYLQEDFVLRTLENKWYLVRKDVFEDSRSLQPNTLLEKYNFPLAVLCAYSFFAYWFYTKETLWKYDFVWCSDIDHNQDRIYVGKYNDIEKVNKNGFSIHRYLALRECYGAINMK